MRLIDADELKREYLRLSRVMDDDFIIFVKMKDIIKSINNAQTVDAVEVVRCKECKYWIDKDGTLQKDDGTFYARCNVHNHFIHGEHYGWCPTEDDFCSYGERRKNDAAD